MMRLAMLLWGMLILTLTLPVVAQDAAIEPLSDLLRAYRSPNDATLSPDGGHIAYVDNRNRLCIHTLDTATDDCHELPESFFSTPYNLAWQTEAGPIALQEFAFPRGGGEVDTDLWLFDVATGDFTPLTDDGVAGPVADLPDALVDGSPVWADDGTLYFIRRQQSADGTRRHALMRLPSPGSTPQEVVAFDDLGFNSALYPLRGLSGSLVLSPDQTHAAAIVFSDTRSTNPANGVWLFDLSGAAEPRQLATLADLAAVGVPDELAERRRSSVDIFAPIGLAWVGDSLMVQIVDFYSTFKLESVVALLNIDTGVWTPLMDFAGLGDTLVDVLRQPSRLLPDADRTFDQVVSAAALPDGSGVYLLHSAGNRSAVSYLSLPPEPGQAPALVAETTANNRVAWRTMHSAAASNALQLADQFVRLADE